MAEEETDDLNVLDEFEDEDEEDEEEEEVEGDLEADSESEAPPKKPSKDEKRIRDLQSKYDKVQAELNSLKKQAKSGGTEDAAAKSRDPEVQRWMEVARDATRTRIYESDPRLKAYKIDPAVIAGETPEEMSASARALLRVIGRVETQVRNSVLQEHGFSVPPKDGALPPRRDYSNVPQDEFDRIVRETVGG